MEYIDELTLIKTTITQDEIGQPIKVETRTDILAKPNFVGTKEFYNAMAVGIRPTAELRVRAIDYNNEEEVVADNGRTHVEIHTDYFYSTSRYSDVLHGAFDGAAVSDDCTATVPDTVFYLYHLLRF